jgi:hypothetical protein
MTNAKTLEEWRPSLLIYVNCIIAVLLLGVVFCGGIARLVARCYRPEIAANAAIAGLGMFSVLLWWSLRRCSTPALPAFRGLLLITASMTIGMGTFSLLFVIPAVVFATVAVFAFSFVSLFRSDTAYAGKQFRHLVEFYRKHRMYQ